MSSTDETLCGIDAIFRSIDLSDRTKLPAPLQMFLEVTETLAWQFRRDKPEQFLKFQRAFHEAITALEDLTGHRLSDRDGQSRYGYGVSKSDIEKKE